MKEVSNIQFPVKMFSYSNNHSREAVYLLSEHLIVEIEESSNYSEADIRRPENWLRSFDSWDDWWLYFTAIHATDWVRYHPVFIHQFLKHYIRKALDSFAYPVPDLYYHLGKWYARLN